MAEDPADVPENGAPRELHVHIGGMHCVNCPGLVEGRIRSLPQVETVKVLYPEGRAIITLKDVLSLEAPQNVVAQDGYTVSADAPSFLVCRFRSIADSHSDASRTAFR